MLLPDAMILMRRIEGEHKVRPYMAMRCIVPTTKTTIIGDAGAIHISLAMESLQGIVNTLYCPI
jgi:hypothetical protein